MSTPKQFTWVDPTTNTDGTAITPGEITGYTIGIRSLSAAGSVAGTYPILVSVSSPTATTETLAQIATTLGKPLAPDNYAAAIRALGLVSSDWTGEENFTVDPPKPNPPSGFSVA
jgi:hypothetical protein